MIEEMKKMYLQMFAGDGGGDGGEPGDGSGGSEPSKNEPNNSGDEPVTFDDFLKLEGNQAEFDRRLQKAVNTAVTKAQEKWKALTDDKLTEAERLAKMTKEEKLAYKAQKAEEELAALKAQMDKANLEKEARKALADEGLNVPDAIVATLIKEDAETTLETVKAFTELFNQAVSDAIKDKLRQNPPREGGQGFNNNKTSMAELARKARII